MDATAHARWVTLPATLVGTVAEPGDVDQYQFDGKGGEELVFRVEASRLGSMLQSELSLSDASGHLLAQSGKYENGPDAVLSYRLPRDDKYTLSITDGEKSGGKDHFYRVDAGKLPYITRVFPLGVRVGGAATVSVEGINLGGVRSVKVPLPKPAASGTTVPLEVQNGGSPALNQVTLAVGDEPEIVEQEPNSSVAQAQLVSLPVTINGHIGGGKDENPDADYFRFHAKKDERFSMVVKAARLGSKLDSVIEVLDANGNSIPRATIRCLNQTTTTLADRDSISVGLRLTSTSASENATTLWWVTNWTRSTSCPISLTPTP